jgi:hypothetical protein
MKSLRPPTCRIIAGPNEAGRTTFALDYLPRVAAGTARVVLSCFMNSGKTPELVFIQKGGTRTVVLPDTMDQLMREASQ